MIAKLLLPFALTLAAQSPKEAPRPNPLAPSLPLVSDEEQERFEKVIDRFIQFEMGKLTPAEGTKAVEDFKRLPPASVFALIDGFNRAANLEASCPAVVIGKKIQNILNASADLQLLTYAKETLGVGVTAKRHLGMLRDVQFSIQLRKGAIQRANLAAGGKTGSPGPKGIAAMSLAELSKAAEQRGPNFQEALTEIEKRQGPKVYDQLVKAVTDDDRKVRELGERLLAKHVEREAPAQLKLLLKHELTEVRKQAVEDIRRRKLRWGDELIARLQDAEESVRQAARAAMVALSGGQDLGPERDASFGDRETAARRWREWWAKQSSRLP